MTNATALKLIAGMLLLVLLVIGGVILWDRTNGGQDIMEQRCHLSPEGCPDESTTTTTNPCHFLPGKGMVLKGTHTPCPQGPPDDARIQATTTTTTTTTQA